MVILFAFDPMKREGHYYFFLDVMTAPMQMLQYQLFLTILNCNHTVHWHTVPFIHLIEYCHKAQLTYVNSAQYAEPSVLTSKKCWQMQQWVQTKNHVLNFGKGWRKNTSKSYILWCKSQHALYKSQNQQRESVAYVCTHSVCWHHNKTTIENSISHVS